MTTDITVFGYGSLMNADSLRKTVPTVDALTPAMLHGHTRLFSTKAKKRSEKSNEPICVLNIKEAPESSVNGICFTVPKEHFDALRQREQAYDMKEVTVETLYDRKKQNVITFIDRTEDYDTFVFDEPLQIDYLQICIDGARAVEEDFYNMFLDTTHINNKKLRDIEHIRHLI